MELPWMGSQTRYPLRALGKLLFSLGIIDSKWDLFNYSAQWRLERNLQKIAAKKELEGYEQKIKDYKTSSL